MLKRILVLSAVVLMAGTRSASAEEKVDFDEADSADPGRELRQVPRCGEGRGQDAAAYGGGHQGEVGRG